MEPAVYEIAQMRVNIVSAPGSSDPTGGKNSGPVARRLGRRVTAHQAPEHKKGEEEKESEGQPDNYQEGKYRE